MQKKIKRKTKKNHKKAILDWILIACSSARRQRRQKKGLVDGV
jgi:hypothetical protein